MYINPTVDGKLYTHARIWTNDNHIFANHAVFRVKGLLGCFTLFSRLLTLKGKCHAAFAVYLMQQTAFSRPVLDKIAGKVDGKYFSVVIVVVDI